MTPAFIALLRKFSMPVVFTDHVEYPSIADVTGDFVYARLQNAAAKNKTGYTPAALTKWIEINPAAAARSASSASASAAFQDQTATGKLKALMTPMGPSGCHCSYMR